MSSPLNSFSRPEEWPGSGCLPKVSKLGLLTESIAKEPSESLCCVIINASTCARMLAADPPNVEVARETAPRTISCSNRAAEAISHLRALLTKQQT